MKSERKATERFEIDFPCSICHSCLINNIYQQVIVITTTLRNGQI